MGICGRWFNTSSKLLEHKLPGVLEEDDDVWNSMRKTLSFEVLSWDV